MSAAPDRREEPDVLARLTGQLDRDRRTTELLLGRGASLAGSLEAALEARAAERQATNERRLARFRVEAERETRAGQARALDRIRRAADEAARTVAAAPWDAATVWAARAATTATDLRVGAVTLPEFDMTLPLNVPLLDAGHLLVSVPADRRRAGYDVVAGVLLRSLAVRAPGDVRFRLHDPLGHGTTLSAFGRFEEVTIAHPDVSTGDAALAEMLDALSEHVVLVSRSYLQGRFRSLGEFLATAPGLVPVEVVVLLDLPDGVESDTLGQLRRLAGTCAAAGVSILATTTNEAAAGVDLGSHATLLDCDAAGAWSMAGLDGFGVSIDDPAPLELVEAAAAAQTPPPASLPFAGTLDGVEYHAASSAESLEAVVGRDGLDPVAVRLSDDAAHGLIAGDPGSGKSNLLRVLLYGLAHRYSHEELQIYLLDFKVGVEFKEFGPTKDDPTFLPHARVVSTRSSRAFGAEVLEHVARMSSKRYGSLPDGVRKLAELRLVAPGEQHPRVLLVIDEFQRLFERDDAFAHRSVAALKVLAEQGRAAGFHFLLATQALGDVGVGTTVAQMIDPVIKSSRLRIGMRLGLEEARYVMRPDNAAAANIHARGLAIINDREGAVAGNVLTKIALIENDEARDARAAELRAAPHAAPPRMFDGAQPAVAGESIDVRLSAGAAPAIWLGAELRVDDRDPRSSPPVRMPFARDSHRHLAVIGSGCVSAVAMLQWALIGRLVQRPAGERLTVVLVDRLREDEGLPDRAVDTLVDTLETLGAGVTTLREGEAAKIVEAIDAVIDAAAGDTVLVVLLGADRLVGLDAPLPGPEDAYDVVTPASKLSNLVATGGARGVHVLGWWTTARALDVQLGDAMRTIGIRCYLQLSAEDLQILTAGAVTEPLDWPLAYVHDVANGERPRAFQLFAPFGTADAPEMQ